MCIAAVLSTCNFTWVSTHISMSSSSLFLLLFVFVLLPCRFSFVQIYCCQLWHPMTINGISMTNDKTFLCLKWNWIFMKNNNVLMLMLAFKRKQIDSSFISMKIRKEHFIAIKLVQLVRIHVSISPNSIIIENNCV